MTEYTAEDFARARVAIQGERESARRTYPGDDLPWLSRNGGRWSDHALAELGWTPVQESQPLTADDITDEMVQRLRDEERALGLAAVSSEDVARALLTAALTEPPRPDWADAPAVIAVCNDSMTPRVFSRGDGDMWDSNHYSAHTHQLRDVTPLYPEGVRVTGSES